jgi:hypothetical protein
MRRLFAAPSSHGLLQYFPDGAYLKPRRQLWFVAKVFAENALESQKAVEGHCVE